jgi:hypothetical protein
MVKPVSNNRPNSSSGTSRKETWAVSNLAAATPSTARIKPRNWLPTSPMKMRAGGRLKGRKPRMPAPRIRQAA